MDDELVAEFLTETNESLAELETDMVTLEQNPNDKELLSKIFRLMHTIKGTCGFLGLPRLETVAHSAENVLGLFRDGTLEVTQEYVDLIFESFDRIKIIVAGIEETGSEPEGNDQELLDALQEVYEFGDTTPSTTENPDQDQEQKPETTDVDLDTMFANSEAAAPTAEEEEEDPPAAPAEAKETPPEPAPAGGKDAAKKEETAEQAPKESALAHQTLRVNVQLLEDLMTMISELVLTRNQLLQILRTEKESNFNAPLQRLNHVVSDLQEGVMKTRMQPIGNAWGKLPRIIRDISNDLGKKIDLQMYGQDTELDRQVLEMIKDPLTHMVRNSGDHGIERPAERVAAGKPEGGTITLNAYHEGGHIIIEIKDDGKGLPVEKIRNKIIERGLASPEDLENMTDQQIQQFIFKAGFSTADQVTSVSGRGVGMDVVRSNIEKIGGTIELNSVEGKGSTFLIKIPLTLAIVSSLIVESAGERYAIPQLSVRELVMTGGENDDHRIEMIKGTPVLRLRNHLLPLIRLKELLKLEDPLSFAQKPEVQPEMQPETQSETPPEVAPEADKNAAPQKALRSSEYVVVTQVGAYAFGIVVDKVYDTEEIVVKPVAPILRNIALFSGNTILGDGSVIMILDPVGIANSSGEAAVGASGHPEASQEEKRNDRTHETTSLLLIRAGDAAPKCVPLSLIARLEEIEAGKIEYSNGQSMVQYRGSLMPLIKMDDSIKVAEEGRQPVLVFSDEHHSMGLIVDEIVDIVEESIDVQLTSTRPGLLGSAIINGKATDVLDVGHYLKQANHDWFTNHNDRPYTGSQESGHQSAAGGVRRRILLVDDSPFFRNMLAPLLNMAGYQVTSVESAAEALELFEQDVEFDVIVSDIEMPDMDGFTFAAQVKNTPRLKDTPLVALSSHATPQDMARGREAGFQDYVAKFDRESLLNTLSETLKTGTEV